jgi:hypothetical protein
MGGKGSGRSREATNAVEDLLAAVLRGDADAMRSSVRKIDVAKHRGASGMTGARVSSLMQQVGTSLHFTVRDAVANPPEHLGDIRVLLADGAKVWIEVKGQTKKRNFADITQADYVRDGTDFLRAYAATNPSFNGLIKGGLRSDLALDQKLSFTKGWNLHDLWMADLALLETETKKSRAGVRTPQDLAKFMDEKYLVQLSMAGVRYLKIAQLRPVVALRAGGAMFVEVDTSSTAKAAAIRVGVGAAPGRNTTDFTYHVGYKDVDAPGRHKLHDLALSGSPHLKIVR